MRLLQTFLALCAIASASACGVVGSPTLSDDHAKQLISEHFTMEGTLASLSYELDLSKTPPTQPSLLETLVAKGLLQNTPGALQPYTLTAAGEQEARAHWDFANGSAPNGDLGANVRWFIPAGTPVVDHIIAVRTQYGAAASAAYVWRYDASPLSSALIEAHRTAEASTVMGSQGGTVRIDAATFKTLHTAVADLSLTTDGHGWQYGSYKPTPGPPAAAPSATPTQ